MKVLVTGGSGLLGRSIMDVFTGYTSWDITGTAFSRTGPKLVKLDLTDAAAVEALLRDLRPDVVIHAAAERRPDVCEGDSGATDRLNVDAQWRLGQLCEEVGAWACAISTDYVFDGTAPPYKHNDQVNPLNAYGRSKARGEMALMAASPSAAVLRVGVLFGPTTKLSESAVTVLADNVTAGKPREVDSWAQRRPTYTRDVAVLLLRLVCKKFGLPVPDTTGAPAAAAAAAAAGGAAAADGGAAGAGAGSGDARPVRADTGELGNGVSGILHFNGEEQTTKYALTQMIGDIWGVDASHISPQPEPPAGSVPRPRDCALHPERLQALGVYDGVCTPLRDALTEVLAPHKP